jgi:hypothetical protein
MSNTPHKHAEIIKAWADGMTIQFWDNDAWEDCTSDAGPSWNYEAKYRIKPVPDRVSFADVYVNLAYARYPKSYDAQNFMKDHFVLLGTAEITYEGNTNKIKKVEVDHE